MLRCPRYRAVPDAAPANQDEGVSGGGGALHAAAAFRSRLRAMIDKDDDQVRLYRVTPEMMSQRVIYGARRIEERMDFWIV